MGYLKLQFQDESGEFLIDDHLQRLLLDCEVQKPDFLEKSGSWERL
jgi:hypothetical protein